MIPKGTTDVVSTLFKGALGEKQYAFSIHTLFLTTFKSYLEYNLVPKHCIQESNTRLFCEYNHTGQVLRLFTGAARDIRLEETHHLALHQPIEMFTACSAGTLC